MSTTTTSNDTELADVASEVVTVASQGNIGVAEALAKVLKRRRRKFEPEVESQIAKMAQETLDLFEKFEH